jgi:hypothetical protein
LSDRNTRKGISLIQNFLVSGHIQADKAIRDYVDGEAKFAFPFHEVFKGSVLGPWKYYKEDRSEVINIFDSRLGSRRQQLATLYLLRYLQINARIDQSEVELKDIIEFVSNFGASKELAQTVINRLLANNLIHTNEKHLDNPKYFITLCGGYYINNMCKMFVYIETVMYDTNVFDTEIYNKLCEVTYLIEHTGDWLERMNLRKNRLELFFKYLKDSEDILAKEIELKEFLLIADIEKTALNEIESAIKRIELRGKGD